MRAGFAFTRLVRRAAFGGWWVAAIEAGRASRGVGGATGCSDGAGCCLGGILAEAPVSDRDAVRVRHAVVAVVPTIAAANRGPLLSAHGGSLYTLAWRSDFAAVLGFAVFAERCLRALGDCATYAARDWACRHGVRACATVSRGHRMRVCHADVQVRAPVATADRAVVFRARRRHRETGALRPRLAARRAWSIVTDRTFVAGVSGSSTAFTAWLVGITGGLTFFRTRCREAQTQTQAETQHQD